MTKETEPLQGATSQSIQLVSVIVSNHDHKNAQQSLKLKIRVCSNQNAMNDKNKTE